MLYRFINFSEIVVQIGLRWLKVNFGTFYYSVRMKILEFLFLIYHQMTCSMLRKISCLPHCLLSILARLD